MNKYKITIRMRVDSVIRLCDGGFDLVRRSEKRGSCFLYEVWETVKINQKTEESQAERIAYEKFFSKSECKMTEEL